MKILLVYPEYPDTFWSFRHALKFVSKKAPFPPLGLITVAPMLPGDWEKKLIDMNVTKLTDENIKWADYLFLSAMVVQRESALEVIARAKQLGTKIVAGGPLFTTGHDEFKDIDHFVLGEAENSLPPFLADLRTGHPQPVYTAGEFPDIALTPVPDWSLLDINKYSSMSLQYSRGCPFDCDFCDIIVLNGHLPRTKSREQILRELDSLYDHGWRGGLFMVDDNFIGNRKKLKNEILPAMAEWMRPRKFPFVLSTEASINLADDKELMGLLVEAGFNRVFVGIETPNEESLVECNKGQNIKRDLMASVKEIHNHGLEVQGGFIVGFDSDPISIFKNQINFIQKSGIVTAMVGLLNAPRGTRLYQRLKGENRLLQGISGDNTDCSMNFIPKMNRETLLSGYKQILTTIYAPRQYYDRIRNFLAEYRPHQPKGKGRDRIKFYHVKAFLKSLWLLGIKERGRLEYWRFLLVTFFKYPRNLPISVYMAIYGYHFRKVVERLTSPIKGRLAQQPTHNS
ncbi:MAG: DUF4070 domain-containing protein [Chloroflexota bacterium]